MPTYNERENVQELVTAVRASLDVAGIDGHVLVIDDGSPDGTGAIVDSMADSDPRVHVLHRDNKAGIGPAYISGFRYALQHGASLVLEMDCDFSHNPRDVPRLIAAAADADAADFISDRASGLAARPAPLAPAGAATAAGAP